MKILIVTQYFWPETFVINDLAIHLSTLGHSVTVLTGKPNYPEGRIFDGYLASGIQHEKMPEGVLIHRVPLRPRSCGGAKNLLLNYLSFLFSGLLRFPRLVRGQQYDFILFFAPSPMTSALTAIPLKYMTKAHLAVWIQDLWPESLSATGYVNSRPILFLVKQIVRLIYGAADTLLIQSQAFFSAIATLADERKIVYFPNFSRLNCNNQDTVIRTLPTSLLETLENHFCVIFAGNLGTAQSLDTILDAASKLTDISQIKILLVGSGSMVKQIELQLKESGINNVLLPGRLPVELMPKLFQLAQGLLVTLKNQQIFSYTVPSKFQGYLAAGKPIIAAVNGETARILTESGAGYACEAENASALADNIRKLYHLSDEDRDAMGKRGLDYFKRHFEMDTQVKKLIEILQQRIDFRQA